MQYQTKELNITAYPNGIVEVIIKEDLKGSLSIEEVENNLTILEKIAGANKIGSLIHVPNFYIPKNILRKYSDIEYVAFTALVANSYPSKLIGNLFLSTIFRFNPRKTPVKIFLAKNEAFQWLEEELKKEKQGL